MAGSLAASFEADLRCSVTQAELLATLARDYLGRMGGTTVEDSDEDLVLRLRDPRMFGDFVGALLPNRRLESRLRIALVERAFDLLPLPRGEGDVILVEARAPPQLLALAAFLMDSGAFSVLHLMHLVYAVFLDRSLVLKVPRDVRTGILHRALRVSESPESLRILYACMQLAKVPTSEAVTELRRLFRDRSLPESLRRSLASTVASDDGGVKILTRIAKSEGLLFEGAEDTHSPSVVANIPQLPRALVEIGRRYLS